MSVKIPDGAVAWCNSPAGAAYRGKIGCQEVLCSRDGNPERCYGWHCLWCDELSNCQGDCSNPNCPGEPLQDTDDETTYAEDPLGGSWS